MKVPIFTFMCILMVLIELCRNRDTVFENCTLVTGNTKDEVSDYYFYASCVDIKQTVPELQSPCFINLTLVIFKKNVLTNTNRKQKG